MYPQWQILYIHNVLIDVTQTCYNILVFRGHLDLWGKKLILSATCISVHVNSHVSVQIKKPSLFFNDRREGSQITCIHTCLVETIYESASQIFPTDGWRGGGGGSLVRLNPELAICSFSWGRGVLHLLNNPPKQIHHWCLPAVSNNGRHARIKKKIPGGAGLRDIYVCRRGWGLRPTFLVILLCKF